MLGRVNPQQSLFPTSEVFRDRLSTNSFYAWIREHGDALGSDDDFAHLYSERGRPSHPPSVMLRALLLQAHDRASDREAARRTRVDEDWRAALGFDLFSPGIGATTFSLHRARLVLTEADAQVFRSVLRLAQETGALSSRQVAVIDSTAVEGATACHSAAELLGVGIRQLRKALGEEVPEEVPQEVDWEDRKARRVALSELVSAARELLSRAEGRPDAAREAAFVAALVAQETTTDGRPRRRGDRASDRIVSHTDPEQRHGRTTGGRSFSGYRLHQLTDPESELVLAVEVGPANRPDAEFCRSLLDRAGEAGVGVTELVGDTAYGNASTREVLAERGVEVTAPRAPRPQPKAGGDPKEAFSVDLEAPSVTCPEGVTTTHKEWILTRRGDRVLRFRFPPEACGPCPSRPRCTGGKARTVKLHPKEALLQEARRRLADPAVQARLRLRHVVERKNDHLKDLGMRKARYRSRRKVLLQAHLAATVANFSRLVVLGAFSGAARPLAA